MAAPSVRVVGTPVSGTAAITVAPHASHAAGDVEYLLVESDNGATCSLSTAAGFAAVTGGQSVVGTGPSTSSATLTLFWRRWNGTDGSPVVADTGNHTSGVIVSVQDPVATDPPHEAVTASTEATADTSGAIAGGTTTGVDRLVLAMIAAANPDAAGIPSAAVFSAWANAALTGIAEIIDYSTADGNGGAVGAASGVKATAGAIGNTTVTQSSSAVKAMLSLAVLPVDTSGFSGTIATTVAAPTSAASAVEEFIGSSAASVAAPTSAATGLQAFRATAATAVSAPTSDASGAQSFRGTAGVSVPAPTSTASGALRFVASAGTSIPAPTSQATGDAVLPVTGTIDVSVSAPTSAATAAQVFVASAAVSIPTPTTIANATQTMAGAITTSVPAPTSNATAKQLFAATMQGSIAAPTSSGVGAVGSTDIVGTMATSLPAPTSHADAALSFVASMDVSLLAPISQAVVSQGFLGQATAAIPAPTSDSTGLLAFRGAIDALLAAPTSSAEGTVTAPPLAALGVATSSVSLVAGAASVARPASTAATSASAPWTATTSSEAVE